MKTLFSFRFFFLLLVMLLQVIIIHAQPDQQQLLQQNQQVIIQQSDYQELVKIYTAADGDNWINSWNLQQPISTWYGVTLSDNEVIGIDLSSNNLVGTLPANLDLPVLETLNVSDNRLSGVVPYFGDNLVTLNINENEFSFSDIAENYQQNNSLPKGFLYQKQYYGRTHAYRATLGKSVDIKAEYDGQLTPNTTFTWLQRNSKSLSTDSIYSITSVEKEDIGRYYVVIQDSELVPDMTVFSYDRIVHNFMIDDGNSVDSEGAPVRPNELILNLNLLTPAQLAIINNPNLVQIIDRCNCKNDLILIKILDDDVYEQLIDINSKTESSESDDRESTIDSGDNNYDIRLYNEPPVDIWELEFTPEPAPKGQSVKIAVIDTGYENNDAFNGYTVEKIPPNGCAFGANFVTNNNNTTDDNGHGNHIASLIVAETPAKLMTIIPIKAFNEEGAGTLFDMICGLHYALDQKVDIINLSASYWGEKSDLLEDAVSRAQKEKTLIVTSAGNGKGDGKGVNIDDIPFYPAALPHNNLVVVGCIRPNPFSFIFGDDLSTFSNYSATHVDIVAYGECIKAAGLNNELAVMGGTSQSTALVTRSLAIERAKGLSGSIGELVNSLPAESVSALAGKIKTAKKIASVKQKLTSWAFILLIVGLIILLIIFIIWRLRRRNTRP